jgi:hypothetical protein
MRVPLRSLQVGRREVGRPPWSVPGPHPRRGYGSALGFQLAEVRSDGSLGLRNGSAIPAVMERTRVNAYVNEKPSL